MFRLPSPSCLGAAVKCTFQCPWALGVGEKMYFGCLFTYGQNMKCSSRLSALLHSFSLEKHFSSCWPTALGCYTEDGTGGRGCSALLLSQDLLSVTLLILPCPAKSLPFMFVLGYEVESIKVWWKEPNLGVGNGKLQLCTYDFPALDRWLKLVNKS